MKKFLYKNKIRLQLALISFAFPSIALAQTASNATKLVQSIQLLITGRIIPLMVLLALLYTIYAGVEFIRENDDSRAREEKKQKIFWGLTGLFVIISVWSLVAIVANTFDLFAGGKLE